MLSLRVTPAGRGVINIQNKNLSENAKISVTIITGFLGAGKTTFINQILKQYPDKQFALVENEFGEVSIDTKLIKGVDASQMFELKQGCICCTISDEYELVLAELAERFPNVENLMIETTGIADPASVIRPFFIDKKLKEIYQVNGTVCIVDGINFENSLQEEVTIKQVAVADLTLISKSEKISRQQTQNLETKINRINPLCKVSNNENGLTPDFNPDEMIHNTKYFPDLPIDFSPHDGITSKKLSYSQPLNKEEFIHWLSYNLDIYKSQIFRVKGILCFENEPYEFILQGVGGSFEITEADFLKGKLKSEIVFIGKLKDLVLEIP